MSACIPALPASGGLADTDIGLVISGPNAQTTNYVGGGPKLSDSETGAVRANVFVRQDGTFVHYQLDPLAPHDVASVAMTTDPATWDERYCPKPPIGMIEDPSAPNGWRRVVQPVEEEFDPEDWERNGPGWQPADPIPTKWKTVTPCRLFWSPLRGLAGAEPIEVLIHMPDGRPKLELTNLTTLANAYRFVCTIHDAMRGRLIVLPPTGG